MIVGEPMPDKNDPQYKERYEKEVEAGRKFAKAIHIDKAASKVQSFANANSKAFLVIVFGFVIGCFIFNISRIIMVYTSEKSKVTVIQKQEQAIKARHERIVSNHSKDKETINRNSNNSHEYNK